MNLKKIKITRSFIAIGFLISLLETVILPGTVEAVVNPRTPKISLIMSQSPTNLNMATLEFYRAVYASINEERNFNLIDFSTTKRILSRGTWSNAYGQIPVLERKYLVRYHPQSQKWMTKKTKKKKKKKKKKTKKRLMIPVQRVLETLALPGAILVDCIPNGRGKIRACGLYYYDRASGRVTAQARKEFRVSISDASRWAPQLLATLKTGLSESHKQKKQKAMKTILSQAPNQKNRITPVLALGLHGENITEDSDLGTSAIPSLFLGAYQKNSQYGLKVEFGKTELSGHKTVNQMTQKSIGFSLTFTSKALTSMEWMLGANTGYGTRSISLTDGEIVQKYGYIGVRPGLAWTIGRNLFLGFYIEGRKYLPFKTTFESANDSAKSIRLTKSNVIAGTSLGVRF